MCSLDLLKYEILTHFGCNTNTPTVVKYTPECTYGYLGYKNLPGEDPRTPLPIGRTFKIGPATPLHTTMQLDLHVGSTNYLDFFIHFEYLHYQ